MSSIAIQGATRPAANQSSRKLSTLIRSLRWRIARFIIEVDSVPNPMLKGGEA
jgi:hypothetical protein